MCWIITSGVLQVKSETGHLEGTERLKKKADHPDE